MTSAEFAYSHGVARLVRKYVRLTVKETEQVEAILEAATEEALEDLYPEQWTESFGDLQNALSWPYLNSLDGDERTFYNRGVPKDQLETLRALTLGLRE